MDLVEIGKTTFWYAVSRIFNYAYKYMGNIGILKFSFILTKHSINLVDAKMNKLTETLKINCI